MADDPIAGLALQLNEDSKVDRRKTAADKKKREATRRDFTLDDQLSESFRAATESDQADALEKFWQRIAPDQGFDPSSVILKQTPEEGPIVITAIPADVAELREAIATLGDTLDKQEERDEPVLPAIERLERIAADSLPEGRALVRFAMSFMLDQIKHSPRWDDLLEGGQRDLAATLQANANDLVTKIIEAVRSNGVQPIRALLESYSEKDGIKASLKIKPIDDEEALQAIIGLHRAQGKHVLVTVASAQDFDQSPAEVPITPDEPGLGFDAGNDDPPADDSDLNPEEDGE